MGLRFFRRIRLAPGLTLNLSKSGGSFSLGGRGARYTIGTHGGRITGGIPGTGLFYTQRIGAGTRKRGGKRNQATFPAPEKRLTLGFFQRLLTPPEEQHLVDGLRELVSGNDDRALNHFRQAFHLADSVFMAGVLELKAGRREEAASLLRCVADSKELGRHVRKYGIDAVVSLPVTDEIAARIGLCRSGALLALVEAYQGLERRQDAVNCLLELREARPDDVIVKLSLAELLMDTDAADPDYCREIVNMTADLGNDSALHAALMLYKGKALAGLGMFRAARDVLSAALRRQKKRPPELLQALRYERACVYEKLGQRARARTELERLYAEAPDYRDVAHRLGV